MPKKKTEETPLDVFKDQFEAQIIYKSVVDSKFKAVTDIGIVKITAKNGVVWVLVFSELDNIIPKLILPYNSILAIIPTEEEEEIPAEEEFGLADLNVKAEVITEDSKRKKLDLESKLKIGTDSIGDIDLDPPSSKIDSETQF